VSHGRGLPNAIYRVWDPRLARETDTPRRVRACPAKPEMALRGGSPTPNSALGTPSPIWIGCLSDADQEIGVPGPAASRLVKAAGYKGYVGIEFEGNTQPEEEGIRKTKALLEKYL